MMRAVLLLPALPLLLSACGGDCDCEDSEPVVPEDTAPDVHDTAPPDTQDGPRTDLDGDGWAWPEDCNDQDASVGPDALDVINGADDNCDGVVDVHTLAAAHSKMLGEASGDWAGANVAGVGDVNADGYADIGISAWYSDASANNAGSLYVVLGPVAPGEWSLAYADVRLSGESAGDNLSRLIGVGDHDGDGFDDVAFCAQGDDTTGPGAGAAYLMRGPLEGPWDVASAHAKILGESAGDGVMRVVAGGDLDGDGQGDLLVGAPEEGSYGDQTGAAYVVLGPVGGQISLADAHAKLTGTDEGELAGAFMVGPGDLNGDGYDDAVIGDHNGSHGGHHKGSAYLIHGPITAQTARLTQAAAAMFWGPVEDGKAGKVARAGDLNGDGDDEWLTASMGSAGQSTFVFSGQASGELAGADALFTINTTVSDATGVGDVNGDGYDDVLIGRESEDSYLFFGPLLSSVGAEAAAVVFPSESGDDYAGFRVAGVGDTDGDGLPDFVIGAKGDDTAGTTAGAAYLLLGSD